MHYTSRNFVLKRLDNNPALLRRLIETSCGQRLVLVDNATRVGGIVVVVRWCTADGAKIAGGNDVFMRAADNATRAKL
jgi:hypothetical protein